MSTYKQDLIKDYGKAIMKPAYEFDPKEYERFAKRFRHVYHDLLPSQRNGRVVDVGCGDGHFLYYLKQEGFQQVEGLDASDDRLDYCRKYVTQQVHCADAIEWLTAQPKAFDVISAHHVIEHFEDDQLLPFVKALAAGLKEDGTLILTTPNACTPWAGYNLYHDLTHCRLFTTDSLAQLLAQVGLRTTFVPDAATPFDLASSVRWMVWKVREAGLKLQYRIDIGGTRGNQKTPLIVSPNLIAVARKTK